MQELLGLFVLGYPFTLLFLILPVLIILPLVLMSKAPTNGRGKYYWGFIGFLLVFLPIFWDWIPTVVAHKYYCSTEAGFWVYKTPEKWKQENPGVMETLIYNKTMPFTETSQGIETVLNQRFVHIYKYEGPLPFNRWKLTTEIRDSKNGEVIAREIGFSTSQERRQAGWSGWKFWFGSERCEADNHRDKGSFNTITSQLEGTKK